MSEPSGQAIPGRRKIHDKLVRDGIIKKLRDKGVDFMSRTLTHSERDQRLKDKLVEEAQEVRGAKTREELISELADKREVELALMADNRITDEQIEAARYKKLAQAGGFEEGTLLIWTEEPESPPDQ